MSALGDEKTDIANVQYILCNASELLINKCINTYCKSIFVFQVENVEVLLIWVV